MVLWIFIHSLLIKLFAVASENGEALVDSIVLIEII